MYHVIINTKYKQNIEFVVDDIQDERVQEILRQEWIVSCRIEKIKDMEEVRAKKLQFATTSLGKGKSK